MAEKGTVNLSVTCRMLEVAVHTVTQKTCARSLVETDKTQVTDDPHGRSPGDTLDVLGQFTLNL
jgi:hypothetical protein